MSSHRTMPPENQAVPRVRVGLPVYNGENFLAEAIESILAQTFEDFELIITDNASTDRTEEICRRYAEQDPRVSYHRQPTNIGAVPNFNHALELSAGSEYFKWAAHDDWIAPTYLEACIQALDSQPDAIVCQSFVEVIDDVGDHLGYTHVKPGGDSPRASDRFNVQLNEKSSCIEIFGVIRAKALALTGPMKGHKAADRTMLLELAMCGRILTVPKDLFFHRDHRGRFTRSGYTPKEVLAWYAPKSAQRKVAPGVWTLYAEGLRIIRQYAGSRFERLRCYGHLLRSLTKQRRWKKLVVHPIIGIYPQLHHMFRRYRDGPAR